MSKTNKNGTPTMDVIMPTGSMEPPESSFETIEDASSIRPPRIVALGSRYR